MNIKDLTTKDKESFNKLVNHPLQSWQWGEFREKLGQKVVRAGIFENGKLTSAFQLFFYQVPKTLFTIGYFPKGPLPDKEMVDFLRKTGQQNKAIFIKLEPNIPATNSRCQRDTPGRCTSLTPSEFPLDLGLVPGKLIFTKYTSVIDLIQPEEELLAKMHPKTRYNIRLAQKHGVVVEEDNSSKAFNQYLKLLFETTKRQGFYAHSEKFHRFQWQVLQPAGISHLLVAKHQGKILSTFLLFLFNNKLYYPYGASTRENKELMAPNLLMWEAIKFGKRNGAASFDLWGETNPDIKETDPWYGFHRFKMGYSPTIVEFIGAYDLVINSTLYKIYTLTDKLRWKFLRLKSKVNL